jgi:hypothetical protein
MRRMTVMGIPEAVERGLISIARRCWSGCDLGFESDVGWIWNVNHLDVEELRSQLDAKTDIQSLPIVHEVEPLTREELAAMEYVSTSDPRPPCPRCGEPCHRVAAPIESGDPSWVWGHDCDPLS